MKTLLKQARIPRDRGAVEVDVAEHAFKLREIVQLDRFEGGVDSLADVVLGAGVVQGVESRPGWQHESLAGELAVDAGLIAILGQKFGLAVADEVRDVLQEEQDEDVVLVLRGVDGAPQRVAGLPDDVVDVLLGGGVLAHWEVRLPRASPAG